MILKGLNIMDLYMFISVSILFQITYVRKNLDPLIDFTAKLINFINELVLNSY